MSQQLRATGSGPIPSFARWESVSPLIGTGPTRSLVAYATSLAQCQEAIAWCRENGATLCPRGSGHSYGDMPLNDGQMLLDTRGMNRIVDFDRETGRMVVGPGVRIVDVYKRAHGDLFTLRASPSEGTITVAGAIANNVNGKDSWKAGNFGDQVLRLQLLTASGELLEVDRDAQRELFAAVVGGMGLVGVIVEATLQLERIRTPYLETSRVEARDVDQLLELLARAEQDSDFAIGWVDAYARGKKLGRSVVHSTRWLERPDIAHRYADDVADTLERLGRSRHKALLLHRILNHAISAMLHVQRLSVRLFNKAYFVFCALRNRAPFVSQAELFIEYNFFPNLQIPPAALLCGPRGYTLQTIFSRDRAASAIREQLELVQRMPCPPVTTVLRLHRRDDYLLSFSADGYSLNFEFHPKARHVEAMARHLDELIECVIRHGGKIHLAKDHVLRREQFERLFPRHREYLDVKRRLDPDGLFSSDLFRRLFGDAGAS